MADSSKTQLKVVETQVQDHPTKGFWRINLKETLQPGKTTAVSYCLFGLILMILLLEITKLIGVKY